MKELTTEEKAKAYDKVREKIAFRFGSNVADEIFSKFEMSEEERIRKALVRFHKSSIDIDGIEGEDIIAWLEKQGEQKPQRMVSAEAKEALYDKPAWSEEDEKHIDSLLERLEGMCKKGATFTKTRFAISQDMDWLKSLKERIGG